MPEMAGMPLERPGVVFAVIAAAFFIGFAAGRLSRLPQKEQAAKVKEWLLWAVVYAERELDSIPGRLKLRWVYDLFVQRFPAAAAAVSFDTFRQWVDEALEEAEKTLGETGKEVGEA